jgi:ankyrin repeat protein
VSTHRSICVVAVCLASLVLLFSSCNERPNPKPVTDGTIWSAANVGDLPQVERLLQQGVKVDGRDKSGKTPLHYAVQSKNVKVVRLLIQHGADVNATTFGNVTPLMLSVDMAFGDPDIAMELLRAGANVKVQDTNGDSALLIATTESSYQVMEAMLDKGANPNAQGLGGQTPLHWAATNAMVDRVKLLLDHGADPHIRSNGGLTPLQEAQTTNPDSEVRKEFEATRSLLLAAMQKGKPVDAGGVLR